MNRNVVFFDAKKVNENYDFSSVANKVLDSWWYILGEQVINFEKEYARYLNAKHCISVANGTEALEIALRVVGIQVGDIVVAVANAGFYSSTAIYAVGAKPYYVDINPDSLTMSSDAFLQAINKCPKAVIVTHLYGQLAPEIENIVAIAKENGISVIEDCAQAHGASRGGRKAGTFGNIACYSFYPTKNLGALGDGGAISTNDDQFAMKARQLRQYGWSAKYRVACQGGRNSRLDEIQAAFLRLKLPSLDATNEERRKIALKYNSAFADLPLTVPAGIDESYVAHLYVVRTSQRDKLVAFLRASGVSCDIHYPIADHQQEAFKPLFDIVKLKETEVACNTILSLPCYPGLSDEDIKIVIRTVRSFFEKGE